MNAYLRPVTAPISSSWSDHRNRNPPSSEPGTDYESAYGTPVLAAGDGTVSDYSRSNGGGTGRFLTIDLDDGRRVRYLHLASTWLERGARVSRGSHVATSGASGKGSDWGYGAHVHTTLFPAHAYDFNRTLDFELYVGEPDPGPDPTPDPPPEDEDNMAKNAGFTYTRSDGVVLCGIVNTESGYFTEWHDGGGSYNSGVAGAFDTPTFAAISEGHRNNLYESARLVREELVKPPATRTRTRHPLSTQAWIGIELLGLIALVEVVQFIVDKIVPG